MILSAVSDSLLGFRIYWCRTQGTISQRMYDPNILKYVLLYEQ